MLNVPELFQQWRLRCSKVSQKILWNLSIFAGFWKIWNERNNRIFRNKSTEVEEIADSIVWMVSDWAIRDKAFENISLHESSLSSESCFQGGSIRIPVNFPHGNALLIGLYNS